MGFSKAWFSIGELRSRISKDKRKYKFNKAFSCEKMREKKRIANSSKVNNDFNGNPDTAI